MTEKSKITTVDNKLKNPGRVAAGKRLAAISKEAKARKVEAECIENSNLLYITVGIIGATGLGYGVYNLFCKKEEPQQQQQEKVEQPQQQQQEQQQPEKKSNFDEL